MMTPLSKASRRQFWRQMRVPIGVSCALLAMLAIIIALGMLVPSHITSDIDFALLVGMVLTVLLVSMEVREEPPLMRFFAGLGFAWLAILLGIVLLDYLTR